jgi:hypothetical protein
MKALAPSARALREGRIVSPWGAAYAAAPPARVPPPAHEAEDPALGHAHGFALAAQQGLTRSAECLRIAIEFRPGCEDYVLGRAAEEPAAPGSSIS